MGIKVAILLSLSMIGLASIQPVDSRVLIVESQRHGREGVMIITSEFNYAMVSEKLLECGWLSISINNNYIVALSETNKTITTTLNSLNQTIRGIIKDTRESFEENTEGLVFTEEHSNIPQYNNYQSSQGKQSRAYGWCEPKISYYNLFSSELSKTLDGDIYSISSRSEYIDIYSSTVSTIVSPEHSFIYRDKGYFDMAKPDMPLGLERVFVYGHNVFFIYKDGIVNVKVAWNLSELELELVIFGRSHLKEVLKWQGSAIDVMNSDGEFSN